MSITWRMMQYFTTSLSLPNAPNMRISAAATCPASSTGTHAMSATHASSSVPSRPASDSAAVRVRSADMTRRSGGPLSFESV